MGKAEAVALGRAGRSWVAFFYDATGKRRGKSLGLIKGHPMNGSEGISKRQATVLRDRLANELGQTPLRGAEAPRLGPYLDRYLESRSDLKPRVQALHAISIRYLKGHFGEDVRIDRISRSMAADWRAALANGKLDQVRN